MIMPRDYLNFLEEYCDFYDGLVLLEEEKMRVIAENKPFLLEGVIKKEEAAVMKAQGLENKRQERQEAWAPGKTLREIVESLPGEEAHRARQLRDRLRGATETLRVMNQTSADVVVRRLKQIEGIIRELGEQSGQGRSLVNRSV
jgi:hypothetical protein